MGDPRSDASAAPAGTNGLATALVRSIGVGCILALCCWISINFTRLPGSLSTLWIASGILTGILLTSRRSAWPGYALAALAANLVIRATHGDPWHWVLALAFANTLDATLVAWILSRAVDDITHPANVKRVALIAVCSAMVACALSGLIAASTLSHFGNAVFARVFTEWFASHTLGMVIFATLTVVARAQGWRLLGKRGQRLDLALSMLATVAICLTIFTATHYPLLFLIYPVLMINAFRHRFSGVVFGVTAVTAIAVAETLSGHGPFLMVPNLLPAERILLLQMFIASICLLSLPVAIVMTDRNFLVGNLRDSERRYRTLADYSRDLVERIDADGNQLYLSPSVKEMLGWDPVVGSEDLRWALIHPEDREKVLQAIKGLVAHGGSSTITYRVRHRDGHYVWIEALGQRVVGDDGRPEIISSSRDISSRIAIQQALMNNQRRLIAITDNMPAFVMHVDTGERYTFANAPTRETMGVDPDKVVGMTVREFVGEENYREIKPKIDAALGGETVTFEIEREFRGQHYFYQSTYVPDVDTDGKVAGFYVMTSDISQLKRTEQELTLLARYDGMTGLANRFHFNESTELALARHRRNQRPLALLYLDIDHFKQINDSFGHAVGDEVLREFARRLKGCLRVTDFAARLGGDEFVVLVENADAPEIPELIARKMIAAMEPPVDVDGQALRVSTSIGIAFCMRNIAGRDQLLHIADKALYAAKAGGRNTYRTSIIEDPARQRSNG